MSEPPPRPHGPGCLGLIVGVFQLWIALALGGAGHGIIAPFAVSILAPFAWMLLLIAWTRRGRADGLVPALIVAVGIPMLALAYRTALEGEGETYRARVVGTSTYQLWLGLWMVCFLLSVRVVASGIVRRFRLGRKSKPPPDWST